MNFTKCSLGLNTRIKDRRNFIANYSYELDKDKFHYTKNDDKKKCEIFGIEKSNIDFVTHKKLTGCGEHFYPLSQEFKTKKRIGSDSGWNRIPVSGSNRKYKDTTENMIKINEWLKYCQHKGAVLYHDLDDSIFEKINNIFIHLEKEHNKAFVNLIQNNF